MHFSFLNIQLTNASNFSNLGIIYVFMICLNKLLLYKS
jgi:hypothetical protein